MIKNITVIIPVYNIEKYIIACINSILNQTYKQFELILVDDGSTDTSGTICDEYAKKDNRIRVIHKKMAVFPVREMLELNMPQANILLFAIVTTCITQSF